MKYLTWDYKRNFAAGKEARLKFKEKSISYHDQGEGFSCCLKCKDITLSPRQLLTLMDSLGFRSIFFYSKKELSDLYFFKLYLINKRLYKINIEFHSNPLIKRWKEKHKEIDRKTDLLDDCVTEIERKTDLKLLPEIFCSEENLRKELIKIKDSNLDRIKTYREYININPADYKNVFFSQEAKSFLDGSWYIEKNDILVTTKEDYKKSELRVSSYSKKEKYPDLDLKYPNQVYLSKFSEENVSELYGELTNGVRYYCYNLPYEYYSQHQSHHRELFYDHENKVWKSSSKRRSSLLKLVRDIANKGYKYPLCFVLGDNYQLIPIGCHTRIMIATFLKLPTIPAVILIMSETFKGDESVNNKELAKKYLAPFILI